MSESTTRGRGRGRGRGGSSNRQQQVVEAHNTLATEDFSPPAQAQVHPQNPQETSQPGRQRRPPAKSAEELRRVMDIIQSRISVIIDSLEGDDNDASLKRNVATAVKHLKQINALLG